MRTGRKTLIFAAAWWPVLIAVYLLYAGSLDPAEFAAGGIASGGTVLIFFFVRRIRPLRLRPEAAWLRPFIRLPRAAATESCLLLFSVLKTVAGKRVAGTMIEHPFLLKDGGGRTAALTAYITYGVCISPNSYLVGIDRERKSYLIHQLAGGRVSASDRLFLDLQ